ncbi:hypothetical protein I6A60_02010 [Frankia sp. AgB1.9]|uniref:hypothetical protein n=1 Tax=unclassified Frankia TaxID=2632575 RepID=UPI0019346F08|nr:MULTISPECIES: hypothetical protein [unclassified Frankia]MBL7490473.1 hypothetical protein [Frankia sp. AgW1.1]MBL7546661.1 hypothetical protein [Frankia sp. AgB1.9]MBL7618182.1 hypothetical protein [Frankia sp. AgB1.8]
MKTRIVAAVALAMTLAACGGGSASGGKPTTAATTTLATTVSAIVTPTSTSDIAALSVKSQYPQFASADNSTIDEVGAKVCAAARAGTLDALISASEATLHMSQADTVDFTHVVANAYCSEVPLPAITPASTAPPVSATAINPGTWLVGKEVLPGTYETTAGTDVLHSCYWARLSGTSGESSEILANDNVEGHGIVTIKATDVAFQTHCTWTKIG